MQRISSVIVNPTKKHSATVFFLHGYHIINKSLGDSGHGWSPVGDMFSAQLPNVKWVFPNAPDRKVTLNYGARMPAWYDIFSLDKSNAKEDQEGMMDTVSQCRYLFNQ